MKSKISRSDDDSEDAERADADGDSASAGHRGVPAKRSSASWTEKVGYGLGDTASNLYWKSFEFFLLYFYTDVFGLRPAQVATLFLFTRLLDAFSDPLVGFLADRTETRWGKFRPYLLWVPLPLAVAVMAMFYPTSLGGTGRIVYAYVTYAAVMVLYTAVNTPYGALMGVMSSKSTDRTRLATYRFVLAFAGAIAVQYWTLDLVEYFGGGKDDRLGFQLTMALYGVLSIALFWICFATTRERVPQPKQRSNRFRDDLRDLIRNGPWMVLFLFGMFSLCGGFVRNGVVVFYFKYFCQRGDLVPAFLVTGSIAAIAGMLIAAPMADRWGKKRLLVAVSLLDATATSIFYFLDPGDIQMMFGLQVVSTFTIGPKAVLIWTMYADTADYSHFHTGRRATGLVFSAATFSQKIGCSIGAASTGLLLGYFGYVAPTQGVPVEQSLRTLEGMRLMMSLIPAFFAVIASVCLTMYAIDRPMMRRIEEFMAAADRESV